MRRAALFAFPIALGAMIESALLASPASAQSITACQMISASGSYELAANLSTTDTNCLVITASFVTIDLKGFSIFGPPSSRTGISAQAGIDQITVRNGSISGFSGGVDLPGHHSIVEGLQVIGNGTGAENGITANGIVKNNIVSGWQSIAISAGGIVNGNYAVGNHDGIFVSAGSTVIGNTVEDNSIGLDVNCPANVTDNTAVGNTTNLSLVGTGCNTSNVAP